MRPRVKVTLHDINSLGHISSLLSIGYIAGYPEIFTHTPISDLSVSKPTKFDLSNGTKIGPIRTSDSELQPAA